MSTNDDFKLPDIDEKSSQSAPSPVSGKKSNPLLAIALLAAPILIIAIILLIQKQSASSPTPSVAVAKESTPATSSTTDSAKTPPAPKAQSAPAQWLIGQDLAKTVSPSEVPPALSWFATLFKGTPKKGDVTSFFAKQGFRLMELKIVGLENSDAATTVTYAAYVVNDQALFRAAPGFLSTDKEMNDLVSDLTLEQGLPAGKVWQTQSAFPVSQASEKKVLIWKYSFDKQFKVATVDRCHADANIISESQLKASEKNYQVYVSTLQASIDVINNITKNSEAPKLAAIPADPPEPEYASAKFGGSGSGEPTRTGVRALGGAASGAAIGGLAAGGDGAGYGAAAGFLGGLIYDVVSKANDESKLKKAVAAENARRKSQWLQAKKALADQRAAVKKESLQYRQSLLTQYKAQLSSAQAVVPFK